MLQHFDETAYKNKKGDDALAYAQHINIITLYASIRFHSKQQHIYDTHSDRRARYCREEKKKKKKKKKEKSEWQSSDMQPGAGVGRACAVRSALRPYSHGRAKTLCDMPSHHMHHQSAVARQLAGSHLKTILTKNNNNNNDEMKNENKKIKINEHHTK